MNDLDGDGYPTERALRRVRNACPHEVADAIRDAWNVRYGGFSETLRPEERKVVATYPRKGKFLRLATGGWSGNEEVIAAYQKNRFACAMTWRMSAAGGLHILELPDWPELPRAHQA